MNNINISSFIELIKRLLLAHIKFLTAKKIITFAKKSRLIRNFKGETPSILLNILLLQTRQQEVSLFQEIINFPGILFVFTLIPSCREHLILAGNEQKATQMKP